MKRYAKPFKKSVSRNASMCFALRVLRMQIGHPADLSARQPSFFLLHGQKKETKEKAAPYRVDPALLVFGKGFSKGLPSPREKRAASLPRPWRVVLAKGCDAQGSIKGNKPHALGIFRFADVFKADQRPHRFELHPPFRTAKA
ncbi:hypothetical protein [Methylomonas rivi]|uniref:Uncharacterized protein n=1 Tax=Methylomonas rivi TaxID=2952226 RepID=A0ABT1U2Q4_9GAMM|nr:hypothetical protein [Methylomonas sp. WSC-6]MCQ8128114.1 hypothetical protein [Methylomonas sp. WSC-6]